MGRMSRHQPKDFDDDIAVAEAAYSLPQGSPPPEELRKIAHSIVEVLEREAPPLVAPRAPVKQQARAPLSDDAHSIMERVLLIGDLALLTAEERNEYYFAVCKSLGLNPLTRPFEYIELDGKLTLYARRDCADQLRKLHSISIEVVSHKMSDGIYTVHVRAIDKDGRRDEDIGSVDVSNESGKKLSNSFMRAVTKAKRRVTLSLCGLGIIDESEVDDAMAEKRVSRGVKAKKNTSPPMKTIQPAAPGTKKELPPLVRAKRMEESDG